MYRLTIVTLDCDVCLRFFHDVNPLKDSFNCLHLAILLAGLTYIFNFWHSGTLALRANRQGARMSEIKDVG